jgi:hypothetical protein
MKKIIKKILKEEIDWLDTEINDPSNFEKILSDEHRHKLIYESIYNIISRTKSYKDFNIFIDEMSGVVTWWKPDSVLEYYASPEWSDDFKVPIDVGGASGEYSNITEIDTPEFEYVKELKNWYENEYFKKVYFEIKEYEKNHLRG